MANTYLPTVLKTARALITEKGQKEFEGRLPLTQILEAFKQGQDMIPDIANIKKADKQGTAIDYLTSKDFTLKTGKSCTLTGETAGSDRVPTVWQKLGGEVFYSEKQFQNNEIAGANALAHSLWELEKTIFLRSSGVDSILLAFLEANRTQVNAISIGSGVNTWLPSPDFYGEVASTDVDLFYNNLAGELALNNYSGRYNDVCNTMWLAKARELQAQGSGNDTNTAFQFGEASIHPSNLIIPGASSQSVHYIFPKGAVAIIDWNDPLNRAGKSANGVIWGTYQSKLFPWLTFDLFITEGCADTSSDGGNVQDLVTKYELMLNFAVVKQPLSTANETPIFKYEVLK